LLELFFGPEDGGDMFILNVAWLNGLYGVISKKITTTVRTSDTAKIL
jgi:hypothetical protein